MAKLKDIDKAAESKGSILVTIWQFVKFIVVSLLAMIVQFVLLNTLQLIPAIKELYTQPFDWWFFVYPVAVGGLGYFIVSNVANIIAQIVAFFVNKEKTFNFSIEFKNGGFISEENCDKSFDEIINSVKDLYNSAVFGGNVKKITIEMN